jgi:NAD+ synthase (glutamine-hydrolysing)
MDYGFIKVASAVPEVKVCDCNYNIEQIKNLIFQSEENNVKIVVFPELCVTGYSCQDLFKQELLIQSAETSLVHLLSSTKELDVISIVGVPIVIGKLLFNCAAIIQKGKILGIVLKKYLPNYNEFYEKRWFASSQELTADVTINYAGCLVNISPDTRLFRTYDGVCFGIEICEDVWAPTPSSNHLALAGADLIFNLSASDEILGKHDYLKKLLSQQSARTITGYIYSGCGFGESTQDVVYGGNALIYENGELIIEGKRFSFEPQICTAQIDVEKLRSESRSNTTFINAQVGERCSIVDCFKINHEIFHLDRKVNAHPFIPAESEMVKTCEEIFNIQISGLSKRIVHTNSKNVIIGISGGLDSTLALLVCIKTFDKLGLSRKGIIGVTMPGFGTSDRTYYNALSLMKSLGITLKEINISQSVLRHFDDIGHDANVRDVTYENSQARERTQILMDLSNELRGLVIGTGDLSELALGWTTYNGDHMSMYGVNVGIPKTLIKYMVRYVAENELDNNSKEILFDIIDTPISPELIPVDNNGKIKQKTEDIVGPYELHDFFLYYVLRYGFRPSKIFLLAQHAFGIKDENINHYDDMTIKKWMKVFYRRFFSQQFKRSCLPDGPKVGSVSLSPRGDWRMPSDASSSIWLQECDNL